MAQQSNHLRLFCIGLVGLICLFGCDQKTTEDSAETLHYEIDKPYYSGPLRVRVRVSDEQAVLSDLLTLELSAEIEPGYEVQFPDVDRTLKEFKLHSYSDVSTAFSESNKITTVHQYQLEPLALGMIEIPSFIFTYKAKSTTPDEETAQTLTTEPVWIDIATSLPDDPNAFLIADIDDVVEMQASYFGYWMSLGIVALLAMAIGIGIALKPRKITEIRRIYKSAHDIALEILKAIAEENLVEQGRIKEFYEKLSTCLRQYIEDRFQLRAPEQTTEEFLEQLKTSNSLKEEHKQQLQKFLEHCDLVKFARYQPSNQQINESLTIAEAFVEKTKSAEHVVDVTHSRQESKEAIS